MAVDVKDLEAVGIPVATDSKEGYYKRVDDVSPGILRSTDAADASVGWTVQSPNSYFDPAGVPGQVFHPTQLPDPKAAVAAGLIPQSIPEHLVSDDLSHPQGPEPSELAMIDARNGIRDAVHALAVEQKQAVDGARAANVSEGLPPGTVTEEPVVPAKDSGKSGGAKDAPPAQ